jgi:hypothetical protein
MENILEFSDYFLNLSIDDGIKARIRQWIVKYENLSNLHNNGDNIGSVEKIVSDVMKKFGIHEDKRDAVREYVSGLYDISDGLSVIMSPHPELSYNNIDQVQTLNY